MFTGILFAIAYIWLFVLSCRAYVIGKSVDQHLKLWDQNTMRNRIRYPPWLHELFMLLFVPLLLCPGCQTTQSKISPTQRANIQEFIIYKYRHSPLWLPSETCRGP
ncbi:hypothetical protein ES705_40231 [subsurface metagenome]